MVGAGPPVTNRFKPPGRPSTRIRRKNRFENEELVVEEKKKVRPYIFLVFYFYSCSAYCFS